MKFPFLSGFFFLMSFGENEWRRKRHRRTFRRIQLSHIIPLVSGFVAFVSFFFFFFFSHLVFCIKYYKRIKLLLHAFCWCCCCWLCWLDEEWKRDQRKSIFQLWRWDQKAKRALIPWSHGKWFIWVRIRNSFTSGLICATEQQKRMNWEINFNM